MRNDTIAAVATAAGRGGVAVVRVSGPDAFLVAERLTGRAPRPGRIAFDRYRRGDTLLDEGVTLAFKAPRSYTGEDVVEFQCHGGAVAPRRVLEGCLASGARLARRGEFTERAFLNGKIAYEQAEGILDLVDAKTDRAADAALAGLAGARRREMRDIYDALVTLSSTAEHALDVSEDELPDGFCEGLESSAASLAARIDDAIRRAKEGRLLRDGALVVIAGPPNAGKSSLLNALLGESRAIVSATPGTTRDSIEEWLDVGGWPVRLVDTAGLRDTDDAIEGEGVARARALIEKADVVLNLTPADGGGWTTGEGVSPRTTPDNPSAAVIEVLSKSDLAPHAPRVTSHEPPLFVSAKTGEGLDALRRELAAALARKAADSSADSADALGRDAAALVETLTLLSAPHSNIRSFEHSAISLPGDLVLLANRLRAAAERLGAAIGAEYSSDLLDALFSRFCVGK